MGGRRSNEFCRGDRHCGPGYVDVNPLNFDIPFSFVHATEEYATLRDQWVRSAPTSLIHRPVILILFREGHGFVLVYSVASRSTFENVHIFHQSMRRVRQGDPIFILVGNKCDLTHQREVSREEGATLAEQYGCKFMETSAMTAENVDTLFIDLIRLLRQSRSMKRGTPVPLMQAKKQRSKCVIM